MNVLVNVAGHTAPWRFLGSARLDSWLASRPWLAGGGLRVVRVGGSEGIEAVVTAIRRSVVAYDDAASNVSLQVLTPEDLSDGVETAVGSALQVAPQPSRFDWTRRVLQAQRQAPKVFLLDPGGDPSARRWFEAALALVELLGKTAADSRMTILVLDTPRAPLHSDAADMSLGLPVDGVLMAQDTPAVWRAYLHTRIAWEAAGDISLALRWSAERLRGFTIGGDEPFERTLCTVAGAHWASLDAELGRIAVEYFDRLATQGRTTGALRQNEQSLIGAGILWRPLGESNLRPAPWAARAILSRRLAKPATAPYLRGALVCVPIAHEILSRCFDTELRLRSIPMAVAGATVPEDAQDLYAKFRSNRDSITRRIYPASHPSVPDEPWSFTTLGQTIHALEGRGLIERDVLMRLLHLRNAISHGHYVSWVAVEEILAIQRRIAL